MTSLDETHVYQREINEGKRTSLSLLAEMVLPGSQVLDVGIGGGALGAFLRDHKGCTVDGITYNTDEALAAGAAYREVKVADLDVTSLSELLGAKRYQYIICADVLEHLRDPGRVLDAARNLLEDGGRLLVSVPNVAYLGLIAELLGGEFRYRREGLLDQTHVRFFTRNSLLRFLADRAWEVQRLESIEVDLADSEFSPALEVLPPAVRSQLLANPDGLSYQFVLEARAVPIGQVIDHAALGVREAQEQAHYVLGLYHAGPAGFEETRKVEARARIAEDQQEVVFWLPTESLHGLRLDPSDRPGFLHLYEIVLRDASGRVLWQWDGSAESLQDGCRQIVATSAWLGARGGALLLAGNDPHVFLPIPASDLAAASGGELCLMLSWPMSADYRVLAERTRAVLEALESTTSALRITTHERNVAQAQASEYEQALKERAASHQAAEAALRSYLSEVEINSRELGRTHEALHAEHVRTRHELIQMADRVSQAQENARRCQSERDDIARHIDAIQNSTVFRLIRPLVRAKICFDSLRVAGVVDKKEKDAALSACTPMSDLVDVIVPVYRGLSDTCCCIESVLAARTQTPFRLVVINDCGPEPELTAYLRELPGRDARVLLLENEENLGFVGTVNRGMALDERHDVVLLNSDAEVANDWLDRIRKSAYSGARISSVTPLSNNATICSYPRFCDDNDLPEGWDTASLDALCSTINPGRSVEVPTGVGFCMYIRRDSLTAVGLFDVENFGKGYGEENDFCIRAYKAGWRHLLTLDTFVRHAGGVSFGDAKTPREREAIDKLRRLHPEYEPLIHAHVAADPARFARLKLDVARMRKLALPAILAVTHSRGGGTERHVHELAEVLRGKALYLALKPMPDGVSELSWAQKGEAFKLGFRLPADFDTLIEVLRSFGVAHVHIHHLIGHDPSVWGIAGRLGVRYDYTVHDYYAVCPQISLTDSTDRYCGELGPEQCRACLQKTPAPGGASIDAWRGNFRQLLTAARFVLLPSQDAATRIARYAHEADLRVVPHNDIQEVCPAPAPTPIGERALKIAVIGALSPIKGADLLESVAKLAAESQAPLDFHLLGYAYRQLQTQPKARLTVHGAYDEADLEKLLDWLKPDLVWFPAQWPETYSYTLSACLKAALPVVVPNIGALPERIAARGWSWIRPWSNSAKDWMAFFSGIRIENFQTGAGPARTLPSQVPTSSFAYSEHYLEALVVRAETPVLTDELIRHHADLRPVGFAAIEQGVRGKLLTGVVRVRNHPMLRRVVRWVPLSWQTRLKFWLLK